MPDTKISADSAATTTAGAEVAGIQGGGNVRIPAGLLQQSVRTGTVTATAHGFVAGDVLKLSGTTWSKAIATSVANATAIAVVESATTDTFVPVLAGRITLSGLTAGIYYLSDATAGLLTLTAPTTTSSYLVPVLRAVSATDAYVDIGSPLTLSAITSSDISDFNSATRAQVEAELVAGTNVTLTPSGTGASRQITIAATGGGGGSGDVTAAAVIADNAIVRGDGGSKGVQTSLASINDSGDIVISGDSIPAHLGFADAHATAPITCTISAPTSYTGADRIIVLPLALPTANQVLAATSITGSVIQTEWVNGSGAPAVGSITGLGTGVATALAVNVGSAGAPVVNGGALGTPSNGTLTNCTGLPTAGLLDDAVTLAKMAAGTAGNLITYDASGNPAAVATGASGHVLTSNGAGAAPTFQAAPTGSSPTTTPGDIIVRGASVDERLGAPGSTSFVKALVQRGSSLSWGELTPGLGGVLSINPTAQSAFSSVTANGATIGISDNPGTYGLPGPMWYFAVGTSASAAAHASPTSASGHINSQNGKVRMSRMASFAFGGWVASSNVPDATNDFSLRLGMHGTRASVTTTLTDGIFVTLSFAGLIATCRAASSSTDLTLAAIGSISANTGYKVSCVYNGTATFWWFNDSYIGTIATNLPAGTVWLDFAFSGERIAGTTSRWAGVSAPQFWALLT